MIYTPDLLPLHRDDLRASGLSDATIQAARIFTITPDGWCPVIGFTPQAPTDKTPGVESGYVIPYPCETSDGGRPFCRVKIFPPLKTKQETIKYLQARDSGARLYVPSMVRDRVNDPAETLYIVEGEKKTLLLAQLGFAATGIGGVWSWTVKDSGHALLPALAALPLKGRSVVIVPDSDTWDRADILRAIAALGVALESKGADVRVVVVPQDGADKCGVDDYLVRHGATRETFDSLPMKTLKDHPLRGAVVPGRNIMNPPPLTFSDLSTLPDGPAFTDIIEGIAAEGLPTVLGALPGLGKTQLAASMLTAVLLGRPWLGRMVIQGPVAFLDWDGNGRLMRWTFRRILAGHGVADFPAGVHYFSPQRGERIQDIAQWVASESRKLGVKLMAVDSWIFASGGADPNSGGEQGQAMRGMAALKSSGAGIIVIDHVRKPNVSQGEKGGEHGLVGSIIKAAWARRVFVGGMAGTSGARKTIRLTQVKNNLGPMLDPIGIEVDWTPTATVFKEVALQAEAECVSKRESARGLMRRMLADAPQDRETLLAASVAHGISRSAAEKALAAAIDVGEVISPGQGIRGGLYRLSPTSTLPHSHRGGGSEEVEIDQDLPF